MKPTFDEIKNVKHDIAELLAKKETIAQDITTLHETSAAIDSEVYAAKSILKALEMLEKHCGLKESTTK